MLALASFVNGCRLAPAEGNATNQGGLANPSSLVDENYRIRVDWPGEGWQLLEGHETKVLSSEPGLCAYDEEQSLCGCVSVALAPPASLDAYVTDWLNRVAYLNRSTIVRKKASFQEQPAEFFEADGTYSREPSHIAGVAFYYQSHIYRIVVRGPIDKFDHTRSKTFLGSVHLLPGIVKDPVIEHARQAKSGLGFRIADGNYENGIKGFTIAIDPSWGLIVGDALRDFDPDADVVVMLENPEVSVAVRVEPGGSDNGALSSLQENHRRNFQVELLKEPLQMRIGGAKTVVHEGRTASGNGVAYCHYPLGDKSVEITAGFSELYRAASLRAIEGVTNSIAIVAKSNRIAFERSLAKDSLSEHRVGPEYALRGGCFREFTLGLGWCQPEGFWSVSMGDDARQSHDGTVFLAKNLNDGLTLNLFFHAATAREIPLFEYLRNEHRLRSAEPVKVGLFSRVAGQPKRVRKQEDQSYLYSLMRGNDEIVALVTCGKAGSTCIDAADALAKGLVLENFGKAVEFTDHGLLDRRLGIEQQLPPSYHAKSREELLLEGGQRATWESAQASITLLTALSSDSNRPMPDFSESIDRVTRATVPAALLRQRKSLTLSVAGEQAECQSFVGLNYRFDAVTLRHERVLLAWLVASRTDDKVREVLSGLRFLD